MRTIINIKKGITNIACLHAFIFLFQTHTLCQPFENGAECTTMLHILDAQQQFCAFQWNHTYDSNKTKKKEGGATAPCCCALHFMVECPLWGIKIEHVPVWGWARKGWSWDVSLLTWPVAECDSRDPLDCCSMEECEIDDKEYCGQLY